MPQLLQVFVHSIIYQQIGTYIIPQQPNVLGVVHPVNHGALFSGQST